MQRRLEKYSFRPKADKLSGGQVTGRKKHVAIQLMETPFQTSLAMGISLPYQEDTLIRLAIRRDRGAFVTLYNCHIERVYRHVFYLVADRAAAEDITQEVFIKAWKHIHKYKVMGAPFIAWLSSIARNLIADHYRKKKRNNSVPLKEETLAGTSKDNPESITEANLWNSQIRNAVLKLKGVKQKVIIMRFIDELSYKDVARTLKKSEGAIRVIQYRALKELKYTLTENSQK